MSAILKEEPAEMSDRASGTPSGLERVVLRCLEKKPEARFQSARDLAFALEQSGSTFPLSLARPPVKIRPVVAAAAVGVLVAVLVAYLATRASRSAQRPTAGRTARIASIAVLPLRDLSNAEGQAYFADGMTEALTAGLAGIRSLKVI